jgi:alcohol dehydrogenase
VNYVETPEWGKAVRALTGGRGVDRAVAVGGEIASVGFLSTENPGIDFFKLKLSSASFRNITVGDRAGLQDLVRVVETANLKPVIDRVFPFKDAREAFAHLDKSTHLGKIVIRL